MAWAYGRRRKSALREIYSREFVPIRGPLFVLLRLFAAIPVSRFSTPDSICVNLRSSAVRLPFLRVHSCPFAVPFTFVIPL
jgi:hypothetical protein